jgi:ERCC4-type nuclease
MGGMPRIGRRRTLIPAPLAWDFSATPVPPPLVPVLAERGGTQIKAPRGVALVDTREQNPFHLSRFRGWFSAVERTALRVGDYSIAGLQDVCVVERKDLGDLIRSFTIDRAKFVSRLRRMSDYPYRLLVVTSSLSRIKSPYPYSGLDPNSIVQSLIAALAGLGVPFVTADTHELGEEIVASYLYQIHLYDWLEKNDYGRALGDGDL